ncbi:MAG: acyltransferase [Terrimicrobiaceae bacterium]|nr:acyltransferase [Terrimicrobiaceae bacterium]
MPPESFQLITADVELGQNVQIRGFVNLYGCQIGDSTRIGPFVEIQKGARIGRRCKISSHTFICEGVEIADEVFIGHGVIFTNDRFPRACCPDGSPQSALDWTCERTHVGHGASIGSGATILCGVRIGPGAMIGAGSVVTRDVPAAATVAGNPATPIDSKRTAAARRTQQ